MGYTDDIELAHNMCWVKVKYRKWKTAHKKAKKYGYRVYKCWFCNGYHMTSDTKRNGK